MASKMRRAVARSPVELRGLRAQQMRERLVGQRLARLAGIADGERAVAGADGDDAARERIEPALLPAPVEDSGRPSAGLDHSWRSSDHASNGERRSAAPG